MTIPKHIAIIPDGNRRWARGHNMEASLGHEEGAKRFEEVAEFLFHRNVSYVTFWAASEDNLTKRSKHEVRFLISLLQKWLAKSLQEETFVKNKTRFRMIGRWDILLAKEKTTGALKETVKQLEEETKEFSQNNLTILFGYDGRREMIEGIEKIKSQPREILYEDVHNALWTGILPPVDFVIRTGGEPHWSAGFMMWHTANAQFYFTKTLWPSFKKKEIEKALTDLSTRERRFGK